MVKKQLIKNVIAIVVIVLSVGLFILATILTHPHKGCPEARDCPQCEECPEAPPANTGTPLSTAPSTSGPSNDPPTTVLPVTPPTESKDIPRPWDPVKDKLPGEDKYEWADRIYSIMIADRPSNTSEGGVRHIADTCGLEDIDRLTKRHAKCACTNTCVHHRTTRGKQRVAEAQACGCEYDPNKFEAINF